MKIAVLGGSFNPFHSGHGMLAETVARELGYDKILLIPTYIAPHKIASEKILPEQKLEMLKQFCENEGKDFCQLESCEIDRGGVSYTYDTLCYLKEKYNGQNGEKLQGKIGLILGDEMAAEFHKWRNADLIAEMADLIVVHRQEDSRTDNKISNQPSGDYKGDFKSSFKIEDFKYPCKYLKTPVLPVSSTDIRNRVRDGKSFRFLVPGSIYDYIMEKELYTSNIEFLISEIDAFTKTAVKNSRYEHSVRVAQMCQQLCKLCGVDERTGYLAGIGHDMCKDFSADEMIALAQKDGNPITEDDLKAVKLLHGRAAAVLMKEKFGIDNKEIFEAVAHHTSGIAGMCDLAKCLFIADKIEPGRPQSTDEYRAKLLSLPSVEDIFKAVFKENYLYVLKKGFYIYPETKKMVEYYNIKVDD